MNNTLCSEQEIIDNKEFFTEQELKGGGRKINNRTANWRGSITDFIADINTSKISCMIKILKIGHSFFF